MFTQCAHCLTLFRITSDQLKAAEGQVRCCQCNQIFNALETLQEAPKSFSNQDQTADITVSEESISEDQLIYYPPQQHDHDSALINDSEVERSLDDLADDSSPLSPFSDGLSPVPPLSDDSSPLPPLSEDSNLESDEQSLPGDNQYLYEVNDGLETEPDYFASGSESQMSELLDKDSASLLIDSEHPNSNLAEIIELDLPSPQHTNEGSSDSLINDSSELEQQPDTDSDDLAAEMLTSTLEEEETRTLDDQIEEELPFTFEAQDDDKADSKSSIFWTIGSLLLLIPLCGQMAWQYRDNLIHHETGRQILGVVCSVAGCTTPLRKDRSKILVTERSLTAHTEKENTLLMSLEMVNTAPFQQPFPKLQLSLFNDMGALIARRTFTQPQYRPLDYRSDEMMPKLKPILIELELVDPGKEVTGFKFEFL
ncbi:MAG: zinc-ribbon and DUF3426 domain-containing protein [Candidatus Thiodiazotropha sp. L084R]